MLWAKSAGSTDYDNAGGISTDAFGNLYLIGNFKSPSISFGSVSLTNTNSNTDIFIVKFDGNGNVLWAKSEGGSGDDFGIKVECSANGEVYTLGGFTSKALTIGSTTLTNAGYADILVAKYNSSGNVLWANSAGGDKNDGGTDIAVDANGNAYITGFFYSSLINFDSDTIYNLGSTDVFVVKFAASGKSIWARGASGDSWENGTSIVSDINGNSYIAGQFRSSTITFGSITLKNEGFTNIFIAKYDASGSLIWVKNIQSKQIVEGPRIALGNQSLYITADFNDSSLALGRYTLTSKDGVIFIAKFANKINGIESQFSGTDYEVNVFPNPFWDAFNFCYNLPEASPVQLKIYTLTGKEVYSSKIENQIQGMHSQKISLFTAPGLYFYQFVVRGQAVHGKIVLTEK